MYIKKKNLKKTSNKKKKTFSQFGFISCPCGTGPAHLVSTVIHLDVVSVHIQLHVLVAEHGGRFGVPVAAGHVVG